MQGRGHDRSHSGFRYAPVAHKVVGSGDMSNSVVDSLESLGRWLLEEGYSFTTPTPATHHRVISRSAGRAATTLRDVFGWSLPFDPEMLDHKALALLRASDLLEITASGCRSRVRFSSIGKRLYAHSAFPTTDPESIFFGPDTYRFVDLIASELTLEPVNAHGHILDVCCGAGPGGVEAGFALPNRSTAVMFADINPVAIDFARANARINDLKDAHFAEGDLFGAVAGNFDLIIANPPYLVDSSHRVYRSGGGQLGAGLSERIVAEGVSRLAPGGRLVLYTGVAIIDGVDFFLQKITSDLRDAGMSFRYRELDPDVFGEELDTPAYAHADRIAAVALVVKRSPSSQP